MALTTITPSTARSVNDTIRYLPTFLFYIRFLDQVLSSLRTKDSSSALLASIAFMKIIEKKVQGRMEWPWKKQECDVVLILSISCLDRIARLRGGSTLQYTTLHYTSVTVSSNIEHL